MCFIARSRLSKTSLNNKEVYYCTRVPEAGWVSQGQNRLVDSAAEQCLDRPHPSICLPCLCISITLGAGHGPPSRHSSFLLACESQEKSPEPLSAHPIDWRGHRLTSEPRMSFFRTCRKAGAGQEGSSAGWYPGVLRDRGHVRDGDLKRGQGSWCCAWKVEEEVSDSGGGWAKGPGRQCSPWTPQGVSDVVDRALGDRQSCFWGREGRHLCPPVQPHLPSLPVCWDPAQLHSAALMPGTQDDLHGPPAWPSWVVSA